MKKLDSTSLLSICDSSLVEKLNNKICKYLLGVHKYSSNFAAKGDLGSHGLLLQCLQQSMKYWARFLDEHMDHESLVYKSYMENVNNLRSNSNCANWSSYVSSILCKFGLSQTWDNQNLNNYRGKENFFTTFKDIVIKKYESDWEQVVTNNDGKLRLYKLFKTQFSTENYLLCNKFDSRKYFSRLRTSAHRLNIETGRHKRPPIPRESRTCNFCNNDSVEDECHFLLECTLTSELRSSLFKKLDFTLINTLTDIDLFIFIMSYNQGDTEIIGVILDFVNKAFNKRFN